MVRTTFDLKFEDKTLDQHYALSDLHIDGTCPSPPGAYALRPPF